jgi:hypothetical protein
MTAWLLGASLAFAADPAEEAQRVQLERARAQVADQVHLAVFDLLDELVYRLSEEPVFAEPTPVVLAGVSVPVGLGTGLQALMENHLAGVMLANPETNLRLVHCPQCTAVVVRSSAKGTVVSRGVDDPALLAELGVAAGRHALFIDVEAEGAFLVLRARLTELSVDLPIVWSHTLSTSTATPALLRDATALKSAEEARAEYLNVLNGQGAVVIPARVNVRTYALPEGDNAGTAPPPFIWLQTGVELSPTVARRWTSSMMLGYALIPQAYQGLMAQARISRLVTGQARSLTHPDLYLFGGLSLSTVWGPGTASFRNNTLTLDEILTDTNLDEPRATFGAVHVGAELRLGNRVGFGFFLETLPSFTSSRNFGRYTQLGPIEAHSLGAEVAFCF